MAEYSAVLDSSVIIALFRSEPLAADIGHLLSAPALSAVNLAEVASKLSDWTTSVTKLAEFLATVEVTVLPFDAALAYEAGRLREATRPYGLSLGDRACLASAKVLGVPAVTTDRNWRHLVVDVDIRLAR